MWTMIVLLAALLALVTVRGDDQYSKPFVPTKEMETGATAVHCAWCPAFIRRPNCHLCS